MAQLYVVASPIGNLGDVSKRTFETLSDATVIVAEDTRRARGLLSHLGVAGKPVQRLDAHTEASELERVLALLTSGERVALLTDAGTPSVSDPGARLVRECHARSIPVIPIPGPSAVTSAIAASGLVEGAFLFVGFLPRSGGKRKRWLERIATTEEAVVLFEAGNRVHDTLTALAERQPDRLCCVARELTKKFESIQLRPLDDWLDTHEFRGEVTLVLGPQRSAQSAPREDELDALIEEQLGKGKGAKEIAEEHAERLGVPRRALYQRVLALKRDHEVTADD